MALQDEINAILAELGPDPQGIYASVRTRLDILEARINNPNAPAPNVLNPFYLGNDGVTIRDGYGDPNIVLPPSAAVPGSLYLRLDGYNYQTLYMMGIDLSWHSAVESSAIPTANQVLAWDGYAWTPTTIPTFSTSLSGDVTGTLENNVVSKIQGITISGISADGYVLTATSSTAADWQKPAPGFTAGGDLSGTSISQNVTGIQNHPVTSTTPVTAQSLFYNLDGTSKWEPKYGNGPVYNVLDYGLKNDNLTTNDTAFANLMTLITATGVGCDIIFPSGSYIFNNPVTYTAPGCNFKGFGDTGASLIYNGTGSFWRANSYQNYEHLNFGTFLFNSYSSHPSQSNIITNATSGSSSANTVITSGSNGLAFPQSTINVASTTGFASSGTVVVWTNFGGVTISYSGLSGGNQFTGCSGGSFLDGYLVTAGPDPSVTTTISSPGSNFPSTINVVSTTGFTPPSVSPSGVGSFYLQTSLGTIIVTYTGMTLTTFTGCAYGVMATTDPVGHPIQITTATPHGYTTGDQIGIYGTQYGQPPSAWLNCDANNLWTITVVDGYNFKLNNSIAWQTFTAGMFNGAFISPGTLSITGATNTSPIHITTSSTSGLYNGQLIYISGVGGNTAANGLVRIGQVLDTSHFTISTNGNGNYTTGGTITTGGVCLSYSHNSQVCFDMRYTAASLNGGGTNVKNCTFGGFKYGISVDGFENVSITQCQFGNGSSGYYYSLPDNDSTHSAAAIRIGGFETIFSQFANVVFIDQCNFFYSYTGVYHHDGLTHNIQRCNYEIPSIAIIGNDVVNVSYSDCENDGSGDSQGLFICKTDGKQSGDTNNLSVNQCTFTGGNSMIFIDPSVTIYGLTLIGNFYSANEFLGSSYFVNNTTTWTDNYAVIGGGVTIQGNQLSNVITLSDIISIPNNIGAGTSVNHYLNATAALDVGFQPEYPSSSNGIILQTPGAGFIWSKKTWTPAAGSFGGSYQEFDNVLSQYWEIYPSARKAAGLGSITITAAGSNAYIAQTDVPGYDNCGIIITTVQAHNSSSQSFWKIKQRYINVGGGLYLFPQIDDMEIYDPIGLTRPILNAIGTEPACQVQVEVFAHATYNITYAAKIEIDHLGT